MIMLVRINTTSVLRSLFFFFFKQKTAYEMRISDWSSDVCSSDLCNGWGWRQFCWLRRLCSRAGHYVYYDGGGADRSRFIPCPSQSRARQAASPNRLDIHNDATPQRSISMPNRKGAAA